MRKASRDASYVFAVLFLINFLNYLDRYVLTGAAGVIAKELGFGIDGIGYLASAFIVLFSLSTLPLGALADRVKRKNVIAICVTIWSLITVLTALAGNFFQLMISRILLGIGEAGYAPASSAMLGDYFSRVKRAHALSWWSTAALGGLMVGIITGGVVAGLGFGTWRWAFLCTGIPGLLLAFLAWRIREPKHNEADDLEAGSAQGTTIGVVGTCRDTERGKPLSVSLRPLSACACPIATAAPGAYSVEGASERLILSEKNLARICFLLRIKSLLVLTVMQMFAFFVLAASAVYLPTWLQQKDTFGFSSAAAGLYTGIGIAVAGIAGMVSGGHLANVLNRLHPGSRVMICGIGFFISAPCYLFASIVGLITHNIFLYTCLFAITVFLLNIYAGPSIAATQDIVPSSIRASALAISMGIAHLLGDAASPSLVGVLARTLDPTHGEHFVQRLAGYDLGMALICTCPAALAIAGIAGIIGSRWVEADMAAAQLAEQAV